MFTIAIIGGGASGLAAALSARERIDNRVVVLERQNRVGRKLLATGNGRCNLTNTNAGPDRFHGTDPDFIGSALIRFGVEDTLAWFRGLGLLTHEEPSGRVYPLSDAASSVVDTLRFAAEARGAELICGFEVTEAKRLGSRFVLESSLGETLEADRVIVACGGKAGGKLGGTGSGYDILSAFGHGCTTLRPSLVQLKTDNRWTRSMKGVRTQAKLTLERGGTTLSEAAGEVQFTDYGITGPAVFDLSRAASFAGEGSVVSLRLMPDMNKVDIISYMQKKREAFPNYKAENLMSGALHNSIARTALRRAEIPAEARLWALSDAALEQIAAILNRFELPLCGTLGFDDAQVTAGGVETSGFDPETMESRLVPGLYACGEVLDIDGDCGGFNLQWAWSSGRLAGLNAADWLEETP